MATLTAANIAALGAGVNGYFSGQGGSLSPNTFTPTGATACSAILTGYSAGNASVIFAGNLVTALAATKLVIDGVDKALAGAPAFDGSLTTANYAHGGNFVPTTAYTVDVVSTYAGPSWVGVSTTGGNVGTFSISFASSGRTTGDRLQVAVATANEAVTAPTGFTEVATYSPQSRGTGAAAGGIRLTLFEKISDGAETTVSIPDSGDHQYAVGAVFRGAGGASVVVDIGAGTNVAATTSGSFGGVTTTVDDTMLIHWVATDRDNAAASWSAHANANLVNLTERTDAGATAGQGSGIMLVTGEKKFSGATGNTTATQATSSGFVWITLALKNDAGGGAQTLTPGLFTNSQAFYAPTVTRGGITLVPGFYTGTPAFFAPSVAQIIQAATFANSSTFYAPTAAPGSVSLSPALLTSAETFPGAAVTPGMAPLTLALLSNATTLFGPAVSAGAVTLAPGLLTNSSAIPAPVVISGSVTLAPALMASANAFYLPAISSGSAALAPPLLIGTSDIFSPSIAPGGVIARPPLLPAGNAFLATIVRPGALVLASGLFTNENALLPSTVVGGAAPDASFELSSPPRLRAVIAPPHSRPRTPRASAGRLRTLAAPAHSRPPTMTTTAMPRRLAAPSRN